MKQITIKRAIEGWHWIHNNEHYEVGTEWPRDYHGCDLDKATHVYYRNFHEKMRVPMDLYPEFSKGIRPNKRKFDTRMYALTPKAKMMVTR